MFNAFGGFLLDWNEKINLTAIKDETGIVVKHFVDSLSILKFISTEAEIHAHIRSGADKNTIKSGAEKHPIKYVDIGAGAGFPGIPLKIVLGSRLDATLFDSVGKKANFMNEAVKELGLARIRAIHMRAEDAGRAAAYRGAADIAAARAVARLPALLEYAMPLLKTGGKFIAMKAADEAVDEELAASKNAAAVLGCEIEHVERFCLPGTDIRRAAIVVRKTAETPPKFPRKPGTPAKSPL
jgi:16S rRNA (guanine527-N7)-methyltransferase